MSPWDRLELAPTSDTRAIKKAYARLLKQHRPDQDAVAFQQLHQAYKTALQLAEQQADVAEAMPATPPPREPEPEQLANWTIQLPPVAQQEPDAEPDPAADYRPLFQRCRGLLSEHHGARQPQYWTFLARSPELLDDAIHQQLGQALFDELVRHQRDAQQANCKLTPVSAEVLQYLDELFGWESRQDILAYGTDPAIRQALFDDITARTIADSPERGLRGGRKLIRQHRPSQPEAPDFYYYSSMLHRCIAAAIDLFLISLPVNAVLKLPIIANQLDSSQLHDIRLLASVALFILIAALLEHSRWQATPGKWLLGLRVTDTQVHPLSLRHTLLRATCMLGVLLLIVIVNYVQPRLGPVFVILFVINCWMNGNLLQDRISHTHVINLRLSRRRHQQATA